ncbi:DUF2235 domain-containing protein [Thiohalomonas denitrificans]|uniref:DUF2235 domain-containing protein n=1 Tax=Thiohalomonas denitrificans TaxID=415747 RepID=UPI0026F1119F|nr:DUF2235 domain-containing protein [Thiohalomonas denitrificans]
MAKRIVICCDGTWNDEEDNTNVFRVNELIPESVTDGTEQVVRYDRGVGTGFGELMRGGIGGYGLSAKILEAYEFLVRNYEEGDEVFLLGFSRGAFTVRSLCGFLGAVDVLAPSEIGLIDEAYEFYRHKAYDRSRSTFASKLRDIPRRRFCAKFLGVYDTVGSLGIPIPTFARILPDRLVDFHDTNLGDNVENACHAMAIDERRGPFKATYWTDAPGWARHADDSVVRQTVCQVWFPGVHADVGGGYKTRDLSDIALRWLLRQAEGNGLKVDWDAFDSSARPNPLGKLHDSMTGLWKMIHHLSWSVDPYVRPIGPTQRQQRGEPWSVVTERIHESVFERLQALGEAYAPPNLVLNGKIRTDLRSVDRFIERKYPRCEAHEEAQIGEARCTVIDWSNAGVRLSVDARMKVGASVLIETQQGNHPGWIVWSRGNQAGVAFEEAA